MNSITLTKEELERFWSKVDKRNPDECWKWKASTRYKYGQINIRGFRWIASRLSWVIHFGEIPDGLGVLHKCDNPPCVNPRHLFLGTDGDNSVDKQRKGRATGGSMPGEQNPSAKLKASDVLLIRKLGNTLSISEIARRFKIARPSVKRIQTRKSWRFLD